MTSAVQVFLEQLVLERVVAPRTVDWEPLDEGPFWEGFLGTFENEEDSPLRLAARDLLTILGPNRSPTSPDYGGVLETISLLLALLTDPRFREFYRDMTSVGRLGQRLRFASASPLFESGLCSTGLFCKPRMLCEKVLGPGGNG